MCVCVCVCVCVTSPLSVVCMSECVYASVRLVDSDLRHENGVELFHHFVCIAFGFVVDWFCVTVTSTITHKSDAMVRTPYYTCSGSVSGCTDLHQFHCRHHSHYFGVRLYIHVCIFVQQVFC